MAKQLNDVERALAEHELATLELSHPARNLLSRTLVSVDVELAVPTEAEFKVAESMSSFDCNMASLQALLPNSNRHWTKPQRKVAADWYESLDAAKASLQRYSVIYKHP